MRVGYLLRALRCWLVGHSYEVLAYSPGLLRARCVECDRCSDGWRVKS